MFKHSIIQKNPQKVHLYCKRVHLGVQKISKIVINGSILIIKYAVERLDKNKHFKKKKVQKKVL